ncbi:hypothetical protein [Paenibacillus oryzae]|uniref:hypothetical protein n=1 Tax=Paenibacillus oryzae TaxID=1844972 RepID=UPI0012EA8B11|nr:hypothetical protein [Paenibacillus oryzae]
MTNDQSGDRADSPRTPVSFNISVILGELLRNARGKRLLLSASFHALINLGLLVWFNEESGSLLAIGTLAIACTILAVYASKIRK